MQNQQNTNQIKKNNKTSRNLNLGPSTTKRSLMNYIKQRERNGD